MATTILYLHGLESGPHGRKYQALTTLPYPIESPDFRNVYDIDARLAIAEAHTRGRTGLVVVGSSFGGLLAALFASAYPERVAAYLLCAPAIHPDFEARITRVPAVARILHGRQDDVIPLEIGRLFAARFGIPLTEVDDGHRLAASEGPLLALVREIIKTV